VLRLTRISVENWRFRSSGASWPKISPRRDRPNNHSASQKTTLNDLTYGIWTDLSSVLSQFTRLPDRQTDRQKAFSSLPRLHSMQRVKNLYFNVLITFRELQTSRLRLVSAGEGNVSVSSRSREVSVSVSSRSRAFTSRAHPCRQVTHNTNFVKNDPFSTITLGKSTAGRGVKMRYLWCSFNFWGHYCDIKCSNIIIKQNYVGSTIYHVFKFGTGRLIFDPSIGPREWFLKIAKFTPFFAPPPVAPMGASQLWLKTDKVPSSVHGVWKL